MRHGSTQSVAEFYGQYYSNSDLMTFLALTGKYGLITIGVRTLNYFTIRWKLCFVKNLAQKRFFQFFYESFMILSLPLPLSISLTPTPPLPHTSPLTP